MRGERLEIQTLAARAREGRQQAALAAAGRSVHDRKSYFQRYFFKLGDHPSAIGLVPALQRLSVPADLAQHVRHGAGALAAAPAVHQRPPVLALAPEQGFDVVRDVLRQQRGAELLGVELRDLLVQRADLRALVVVEHRRRDRARDMVGVEFRRRSAVDDAVEGGKIHLFHAKILPL